MPERVFDSQKIVAVNTTFVTVQKLDRRFQNVKRDKSNRRIAS